jgi:hypothetical protein
MLGMNDGRYTTEVDKNFQAYESGYRRLVDDLQSDLPGVPLTLIRPRVTMRLLIRLPLAAITR